MLPTAFNIAKFAEYIESIKMLYTVDDDFKTLCDDYITSKANIEKLQGMALEDLRRELEYKQLAYELEKEILDYVNKLS